jgi:ATP-dependent DNA helicase RecG
LDRLHLRIDVEEMLHPDGRIVIVHVPSRPIGRPVESGGPTGCAAMTPLSP